MLKDKTTIVYELQQKFRETFPTINLNVSKSPENAFIQAFAYMWTSLVRYMDYAVSQMFPQKAVGILLDMWVGITVGSRLSASKATGSIWASGLSGSSIPASSLLDSDVGVEYQVISGGTLADYTYEVTAVEVLSSRRLKLTLDANVIFPNQSTVTLSDVTYGDSVVYSLLNDNFLVSIDSISNNIIYINTMFPLNNIPNIGFTVTSSGVVLSVVSVTAGQEANISEGEILTFQDVIEGVVGESTVYKGSIIGGVDTENDEEVRLRVLSWLRKPIVYLNEAHIESLCFLNKDITRVFIKRATPSTGKATVYCIKDFSPVKTLTPADEAGILYSIAGVLDISHEISDYIITSPTVQEVDITISGLSSASPSLKASIEANLEAVLLDRATMGGIVDVDTLKTAVGNSVDADTLLSPKIYEITAPSGDVTVGATSVPVLGTITYV